MALEVLALDLVVHLLVGVDKPKANLALGPQDTNKLRFEIAHPAIVPKIPDSTPLI